MTYQASTVGEYVAQLPEERRDPFRRLMAAVRESIPDGYEERLSYGMPAFAVPHSLYPAGYHCKPEEPLPFLSIASQRNYIGFYHMGIYVLPDLLEWFTAEWARRDLGRLDMGKSCIRLRKLDSIPCDLLAELASRIPVDEWIRIHESKLRPA